MADEYRKIDQLHWYNQTLKIKLHKLQSMQTLNKDDK